jgi:hypothetical protein
VSVVFRLNECPINRPREGVSCARRYLRTALRSAPAFAGLNAWPPGRTHSSRFPRGFFLRSALSRLLFSSISSVCGPAWGGASCARPVVLVPPSLEVGPRVVGASAACSRCLLCAGARRPVSLWRLLCRPSPRAASSCGALLSYRFKQSPPADPSHYHTVVQSRAPGQTPTLGCSDGSGDASGTVARPAARFAERRCMACRVIASIQHQLSELGAPHRSRPTLVREARASQRGACPGPSSEQYSLRTSPRGRIQGGR